MSETTIGPCPSCQEQDSYVHDGSRICGACGFDAPVDDFGGVFGWNRLSGLAAEVARLRAVAHQAHQALLSRQAGSVPGGEEACEALLQVLYKEAPDAD
jgi:hypothetical protein